MDFIIYLLDNTEAKQVINVVDWHGRTPLDIALKESNSKSKRETEFERIINCLLSHGAKGSVNIVLLSDACQGKTTFLMQLAGALDAGEFKEFKAKFASINILPQMVGVVNVTLETMERDGKLNRKELNEALESMEKVKKEYPSLEELKWNSEKGLKDALREIWENKGFQNVLEKKYSAMRQFFERIDEVSKPGYSVSHYDLVHLHLKPKLG